MTINIIIQFEDWDKFNTLFVCSLILFFISLSKFYWIIFKVRLVVFISHCVNNSFRVVLWLLQQTTNHAPCEEGRINSFIMRITLPSQSKFYARGHIQLDYIYVYIYIWKNENKGSINIARSRPKTHECRWETSELKIIRNSFAFLIIIEAKFEASHRRIAPGQVDLTYKFNLSSCAFALQRSKEIQKNCALRWICCTCEEVCHTLIDWNGRD